MPFLWLYHKNNQYINIITQVIKNQKNKFERYFCMLYSTQCIKLITHILITRITYHKKIDFCLVVSWRDMIKNKYSNKKHIKKIVNEMSIIYK